ncbi:unnamed protein product, partial [Discosporangium mesarthrocarpum]
LDLCGGWCLAGLLLASSCLQSRRARASRGGSSGDSSGDSSGNSISDGRSGRPGPAAAKAVKVLSLADGEESAATLNALARANGVGPEHYWATTAGVVEVAAARAAPNGFRAAQSISGRHRCMEAAGGRG